MLCAVYKSSKKQETYLYVPGRDDFSKVPEALLKTFGKPIFLMIMPLKKDRELASVDINKLRSELKTKGFYLQLPPPIENLLKIHLQQNNTDQ
ncbi:YcgL domain-containing protein [uncultured Paraglaciecola sp.]|uniref:YcgL domain-containing protein n=1 Tax=uncultured Paraglaciecola sp. TaxID=1765024 RepID=UPI0030DB961D|tara:strand:- start:318696 stop:318974 length:279 start_codon:yes stop_codon:yes gene_type:complete